MKMYRIIHPIAGIFGFLIILSFWISTVTSELFGNAHQILIVKNYVLFGMGLLIPCMIITGYSGFWLSKKSKHKEVAVKRKRMLFIALNAILILIPCAIYLQGKAVLGVFDNQFKFVQAGELLFGAINVILLGFNIRDGFAITKMRTKKEKQTKNFLQERL